MSTVTSVVVLLDSGDDEPEGLRASTATDGREWEVLREITGFEPPTLKAAILHWGGVRSWDAPVLAGAFTGFDLEAWFGRLAALSWPSPALETALETARVLSTHLEHDQCWQGYRCRAGAWAPLKP